jgi:hypothetical protein
MDGIDQKPIMLAGLLFKSPILWVSTTLSAALGAVLDHDVVQLSAPLKLALSAMAFLGAFIAQLLNFWLRARQQRAKEAEDHAARLERLLKDEREEHAKEAGRYLERIRDLEQRLDGRKRS